MSLPSRDIILDVYERPMPLPAGYSTRAFETMLANSRMRTLFAPTRHGMGHSGAIGPAQSAVAQGNLGGVSDYDEYEAPIQPAPTAAPNRKMRRRADKTGGR